MDAYEYMMITLEQDAAHVFSALGEAGADGWEAVGQLETDADDGSGLDIRDRYLLMKRPRARTTRVRL
jgi:hypothetical protein